MHEVPQIPQENVRPTRLEPIESFPEGRGEELKSALKVALDSNNEEETKRALEDIGNAIHARWGEKLPTRAEFNKSDRKYLLGLATGTSGTRLMINTRQSASYPNDLIFPNVALRYKMNGRNLADVFKELFGDAAENIHAENAEEPYFVVRLASEKAR